MPIATLQPSHTHLPLHPLPPPLPQAISWEKERERFKAARHAKRGGFAVSILYQVLNWTIAHYQAEMC